MIALQFIKANLTNITTNKGERDTRHDIYKIVSKKNHVSSPSIFHSLLTEQNS